jgi:hypothetical protein
MAELVLAGLNDPLRATIANTTTQTETNITRYAFIKIPLTIVFSRNLLAISRLFDCRRQGLESSKTIKPVTTKLVDRLTITISNSNGSREDSGSTLRLDP